MRPIDFYTVGEQAQALGTGRDQIRCLRDEQRCVPSRARPLAGCCDAGGGVPAVSPTGVPQLGQNLSSGLCSLPQLAQYL